MDKPLIIALDFASRDEITDFLRPFGNQKLFLKVGMELYYQEGPSIIHLLKEAGHQIFLDLKLHDIPNTVKSAMKGLAKLQVDLVNVHAAGGKEMMQAALEGLDMGTSTGHKRPDCIAVTQLTSTSEIQMNEEQKIPGSIENSVLHYSSLAKEAGLEGVVCSVWEAAGIRSRLGSSFYTVTPGIRMDMDQVQDQKRVATPMFAHQAGVTAIVVGRSITRSENPLKSYEQWIKVWKEDQL
ncbi:MAG: orotidine-5'-phosphate decarboxylase [Bacillota bacterium]|nr:orotidine-5'-phosphate decarboxylase [Bacillota bacterium]